MDPIDEIKLELGKIPWFRDLKIHHLAKLARMTTLRRVKAGEVIFREGDIAKEVFIVLDGRIALDMLVPPRGRVRFCTTAQDLRDVCDQDHELGYVIMRRLANIVASRLMISRLQLLDIFAEPET